MSKQFLSLTLLSVSVLAGCDNGPRVVPVSGQVLIDGQPVTAGFVRFVPNDHRAAFGELNENGRFTLTTDFENENDGCVVGKHQVEVVARDHPSETSTRYLVPKKYSDLSTSGLVVDIADPTDHLRLELTWDGGQPFVEESHNQGDVAAGK